MASNTPASAKPQGPFTGGCACRTIRYSLPSRPIYIHACHCRYCQRETGSAFALNAMYEAGLVNVTTPAQPELVPTSTESGTPQTIARCPHCRVAVWSNYGKHGGDHIRIIRVGTLDEPDVAGFEPEMHIYTSTKQPWVVLTGEVPFVDEFYDLPDYWPQDRLERLNRALEASLN
ncbi:glutathione-dependent formaldehyde-activating, GFA [Truncatella angustata]|uniref:Glutathione-dependent formaldehyde-activating, GFA n=1 Tax=Truncatella angustata TaxID=152316 RepID=A0A9P8UGF9_9PEZI|nr:glutathione-dependent formaldehyde-activating, GFA [Truncatella angustata]KAH6651658.1 glutathione-dependent formaldehyde-activating, GFA [Truncatella angustata]